MLPVKWMLYAAKRRLTEDQSRDTISSRIFCRGAAGIDHRTLCAASARDSAAGMKHRLPGYLTRLTGSSASSNPSAGGLQDPQAVPTLLELQRRTPWVWVYCEKQDCSHRAPMAIVPFIIRWGPDASSDKLRRFAICSKCGAQRATLRHPSWAGEHIGWQPRGRPHGGCNRWPRQYAGPLFTR